jgi:L-2-hydroxyglutarate oxidase LhgO
MIDHIHTIIIGAGVVGLAIGKALAKPGHEVIILEHEKSFGMGISSRNSEVIHAGLYFDKDWLKTQFCVSGKEMLYDYAASRHITYKRCGKLLIASSKHELEKLENIKRNAMRNGVMDLKPLSGTKCSELEPDIHAIEGVFSPSSGVIDSHALMQSLLADIDNDGGQVVYNTEIVAIEKKANGFKIIMQDGYPITCNNLINAAGLGAQKIAGTIDALDKSLIPDLVMAKGCYFSYSGRTNFNHLVYPLPFRGGLGIHLTIDMAGGIKFGPDVEFVEREDYTVNSSLKEKFIKSISHYFPGVDPLKLNPDYTGIRPKLSKDGKDFMIQSVTDHGIEGLINLFGIESPGLTSCLAIADHVKEKLYDA